MIPYLSDVFEVSEARVYCFLNNMEFEKMLVAGLNEISFQQATAGEYCKMELTLK